MKIKVINIHHLRIPLRLRFEQSNSSAAYSDSAIVKLRTGSDRVGYGESCPRPYVTGEDFASVSSDVQTATAWLKQARFDGIDDIRQCVAHVLPRQMGPAAVCAFELALLDAWCKENNMTTAAALGITLPERVQYSGVVPLRSPEGTAQLMTLMRRFAFQELKLKVDNDLAANLARIDAIRAAFPEPVPLRVDVNCGWSWDDALLQIPALLKRSAQVFEQPFHSGQDEAAARLQAHFGDDICLMADESVTTLAAAEHLIRLRACRRFNLKISKNGGLFNTLAIYRLALENGIGCQLGAHYGETGILTAAGILFGALAGPLTAIEGGLGTHLLEYDPRVPALQIDAGAAITQPAARLNAPGWGNIEMAKPKPEADDLTRLSPE